MSRQSEKVFREFQAFLAKHEPSGEKELQELSQQFMEEYSEQVRLGKNGQAPEAAYEDAYDLLELAENAKTKKARQEYIARALELEPGNLDALIMQADLQAKELDQFYDLLQPILKEGERQMREGGYFKDDMGDFWGVLETRPYMRVREQNFSALIEMGRMKKAIQEGEELLKLCNNDNLGIRYRLMHLYAYMEDVKGAARLHKKYDDYDETQMLLPRSVLYYKLGDLENAGAFLTRLARQNKDAKRFLSAAAKDRLDEYIDEMDPMGYQAASMGELLYCFAENSFLYESVPYYFAWADKQLKPKKK